MYLSRQIYLNITNLHAIRMADRSFFLLKTVDGMDTAPTKVRPFLICLSREDVMWYLFSSYTVSSQRLMQGHF